MTANLNTIVPSSIVVTLSIIASIYFLFISKKINKNKRSGALYLTLFFMVNTLALATGSLFSLFFSESNLGGVILVFQLSFYITAIFSLRQVILLHNGADIVPLYKNRWLHISVFLIIPSNIYLFYYLNDNTFMRLLIALVLMSVVLLSSLFSSFKNKIHELKTADKFLILVVVFLSTINIVTFTVLYLLDVMDVYRIIFVYTQIIQTSICAMAFIILFMLDTIEIQYKSSITDNLTGLYNRKYFTESVTESMIDVSNSQALMFIDIDFFKKINDKYGHSAGDLVIQKIATTAKEISEEDRIVARFGGEEFASFYMEVTHGEMMALAEKLRRKVESLDIDYDSQTMNVTVSIGVSMIRQDLTFNENLKKADNALYQAKETGRNKVCFA